MRKDFILLESRYRDNADTKITITIAEMNISKFMTRTANRQITAVFIGYY